MRVKGKRPAVSRRECACSRKRNKRDESTRQAGGGKGGGGGMRGKQGEKQASGLYAIAEAKMRESGGA